MEAVTVTFRGKSVEREVSGYHSKLANTGAAARLVEVHKSKRRRTMRNGRANCSAVRYFRAMVPSRYSVCNRCSKAYSLDGCDNRIRIKVFARDSHRTFQNFVYSYTR